MNRSPSIELQPTLQGATLRLRPLAADDFEALYQAASDPLIWAQHPYPDRYQRSAFERWFAESLASGGALVVEDRSTGEVRLKTKRPAMRGVSGRRMVEYAKVTDARSSRN